MEIGNNLKIAIGYICITVVIISCVIGYILFWASLNWSSDYTFNVNITADDNLLNMTKIAESMQDKQLEYKKECWENNKLIPCINFTNDEHFCLGNICKVNGICPTYYERIEGKTTMDCIKELEVQK